MTPARLARERSGRGAHRAAGPSSGVAEPFAADSVESRPATTRFSVPMRQPPPSPAAAATPAQRLPGAVSAFRLACLILLACLTCLLGVLTVPPAVLAQQTDDIDLVYNHDVSIFFALVVGHGYRSAQMFRTGPNESGYLLSGVDLWLKNMTVAAKPVVTIHQQHTSNAPGPLLYTLTNPATFEDSEELGRPGDTFAAPENAVLHPNRNYSVLVWNPQGQFRLGKAFEDTDNGAEGWSISDDGTRIYSQDDGITWIGEGAGVHTMRITGRYNETAVVATGIQLTSTGNYHTNDVIEATVTFSDTVTVTGIPILAFQIGGSSRDAAYVSGSETSELVFRYTVDGGDYDEDGVSILPGSLSLPTGASIDRQGSNSAAVLTLPPLFDQKFHRVNTGPAINQRGGINFTSRPTAETIETISGTDTLTRKYGLGETIEITVTFDAPVIVDTTGGVPAIVMTMGTYGAGYEPRRATYARGSGSAALVFVYVVQSGDRDADGISVSANQLMLNGSTIRDVAGRDALLVHPEKRGGQRHKVDAELTTAIATLANLVLSHGTLTPAFDAADTSYTATVSNDIELITVTASATSDATTSILPADADTNTAGHQVSLREGHNVIAVRVSKTGAANRTYTVTVARDGPPVFTTSQTFGVEENRFFRGEVTAQDLGVNDSVSGYAITGGADLQLFRFAPGTSTLEFTDAPDGPNFEAPRDADQDNVYELEVTATSVNQTDATEETAMQAITVTVRDVDEQPAQPAEPVVEAASGSATSVDVRWQTPETNGGPDLIGYEVEYRTTSHWSAWPHLGTRTSTIITGVLADTSYRVRVRALNGETPSEWSPAALWPKTAPGPPTDLTAAASGRTGIALAWTAPADNGGTAITGYRIEVSSDDRATWSDLVADTGATDTTQEHTALPANATRHYRVSALNPIGEGSPSGVAQATTEMAEVFLVSLDSALDENSATVSVTVQLSHLSEGTVTVDYATSDGGGNGAAASNPGDYAETSDTLSIPADTTEAGIDIPIQDDALWEHEESFTVTLTNATGATLGLSEQVVAIADDDPAPTVSFRQTQYEVTEGETDAYVDLIIDMDAPAGREVTIGFVVEDDTADVSVDYEPPGDDTLTLAAEEIETSLRISIIDDEDVERSERFSVTLNDVANTGIQFTDHVTTVTIRSEDTVVPDAPTSLTAATLAASGDVALAWEAPAGYYGEGAKVTGYRIEVTRDGGANWDVVTANTGSIATSYTDVDTPAPAPGAGHHYRVSAINSAGIGPASNEALIGEGRADATLSNLTLSGVTLEQAVLPATTEYTASVLHAVYRITVTPTLNHANAQVAFVDTTDADLGADGHQVDLEVGDNVITVTVTAENGSTTQTYTVTVTRAGSADATLSNLTLSGVTLEQAVLPATTEYTASVLHAVSRITVTPTPTHANAQVAFVDTTDADLGADGHQVDLEAGDNVITVTVTAEDGTTTQAYKLTVTRNAVSETQAAGAPIITGTVQVDEPLGVDTSDITDADGLNNVSYRYQWIRVDGSNEADIAGAAAATYTPVVADLGKTLKVRVSFTDDNGNSEELTSAATTPVAPSAPATVATQRLLNWPPGFIYTPGTTLEFHVVFDKAVDVTGEPRVKMALDEGGSDTRYLYVPFAVSESSSKVLAFIGEVTGAHDSAGMMSFPSDGLELNGGSIRNAGTQVNAILNADDLLIGSLSTRWVGNIAVTSSPAVSWSPSTYGPGETVEFTATFSEAVTPDTTGGLPRLWLSFVNGVRFAEYARGSGSNALVFAWTVPETGFSESASFSLQGNVTPGTSAFRDESGLDLNGATMADAEGRPVNVRHVDFTLPSRVDTLPPVLPGSADGATVNGVELVLTYRVGENDADSKPLDLDSTPAPGDFAVTATGSDTVSTPHAVSKVNVARDAATVTLTLAAPVPSGDVVTLDYTPGANPVQDLWGNAAIALDDRTVRNDTPNTLNTPASGAPIISGTTRDGHVLTAETSGITDADGLSNVSYRYQWSRVDGSNETDIAGATASTHILTVDDRGMTIKVRVIFNDDVGHVEVLISAATATVTSSPPTISALAFASTEANGYLSGDEVRISVGFSEAVTVSGAPQLSLAIGSTTVLADYSDGSGSSVLIFTHTVTPADPAGASLSVPADALSLNGGTIVATATALAAVLTHDALAAESGQAILGGSAATIQSLAVTSTPTFRSDTYGAGEVIEVTFTFSQRVVVTGAPYLRVHVGAGKGAPTTFGYSSGSRSERLVFAWTVPFDAKDGDGIRILRNKLLLRENGTSGPEVGTIETQGTDAHLNHRAIGAQSDHNIAGVPRVVTGLGATPGLGQVTLNWTLPLVADGYDSITGYQVRIVAAGGTGAWQDVTDSDRDTVSHTVTGLDDAVETTFEVRAQNAAGPGPAASTTATPGLMSLGQVTNVEITADGQHEQLTVTWASVSGADGYKVQWKSGSQTFDDAPTDNRELAVSGGSTTTANIVGLTGGEQYNVRVIATSTGTADGPPSTAHDGTPRVPDTPVMGEPMITGTAEVGQTLTADTSRITDADGLINVSYRYQWIRVDGSDETDIAGATGSTYPLVTEDAGTTLKVEVTFTDDAGHAQTLVSAPTQVIEDLRPHVTIASPNSYHVDKLGLAVNEATGRPVTLVVVFSAEVTGLQAHEFDIVNGTVTDVYWMDCEIYSNRATWCIEMQPAEADGERMTLTIPEDIADQGNQPAPEVYYAVLSGSSPTGTFTTDAVEPVTGRFAARVTFDQDMLEDYPGAETLLFPVAEYLYASDFEVPDGATAGIFSFTHADDGATIDVHIYPPGLLYNETMKVVLPADAALSEQGYPNPKLELEVEVDTFTGSTLSALSLSALEFSPPLDFAVTRDYEASVGNDVLSTEVTATPSVLGAMVKILPEDADADTAGHQVALDVGDNTVTVTVKDANSPDLVTEGILNQSWDQTYTVVITRAPAEVSLARTGAVSSVEEGFDAPFTLTRIGDRTQPLVVLVEVEGEEWLSPGNWPDQVTIPANETVHDFTVETNDDDVERDNGAITVRVLAGSEYVVTDAVDGEASIEIVDNDISPRFSLSVDPVEVAEAASGTNATTVKIALDNGILVDADQAFSLEFGGTATAEQDFTVADADGNRLGPPYVVTLAANASSVTATVTAVDDTVDEQDETVEVGASLGGEAVVTPLILTITDDDTNSPATGLPIISGTAQVGETLTASVADIADTDGLSAAFPDDYGFQWVRVDGSDNETNVGTNSTYTLVAADVGNRIEVQVSFTDDAGNPEGPLTSDATVAVQAAGTLVLNLVDADHHGRRHQRCREGGGVQYQRRHRDRERRQRDGGDRH